MTDKTGDGFLGANYYNRGHITFRRSYLGYALSFVAAVGVTFTFLVVVGAMLSVDQAQRVLETVIAGRE